MDFKDSNYTKEILELHLPRYSELPNIALYMDQVLSIIETSLNIFCSEDEEKIITKSMINNYVKQNVIEKPSKKQYQKSQVACLIIVSILKRVLSISDISKLLNDEELEIDKFYDMFCLELEMYLKNLFIEEEYSPQEKSSISQKAVLAAIRAFANKVYFEKLMVFKALEESN